VSTEGSVAIQRELRAAVWLTLLLLASGISIFLTWRRIAGALSAPPSGLSILTAGVALALASALLRVLVFERWHPALNAENSLLRIQSETRLLLASQPTNLNLLFALPGIVTLLVLASITLPRTPAWGIASGWIAFIVSESASWLLYRYPVHSLRHDTTPSAAATQFIQTSDEPEVPAGLVQQFTRTREGDRESLHALLATQIAANDRLAVVHLAFCPPLAARPEVTAHALDLEDAEIRITQVETFGARIEAYLPRAEPEPRPLIIEVLGSVTCPPDA